MAHDDTYDPELEFLASAGDFEDVIPLVDNHEAELEFLADSLDIEEINPLGHEFRTAPLFTCDAFNVAKETFPQRALLGSILRQYRHEFPEKPSDPRIYVNTNTPSSGVVCGVQGSGKSHTVSCLLEGALMQDKRVGNLPKPLAALVFHFDAENGGRPCEAAYLTEPAPKSTTGNVVDRVTVLVSPSNFNVMSRIYEPLRNVEVQPLYLAERDLNVTRMFSLMGGDDIETMPLYMHTARAILREMGSDGFDYREFKRQLENPCFNLKQLAMIKLRLELLDSYVRPRAPHVSSYFGQGKLVIVDLTDPFVAGENASLLFDIVLGMFVEWESAVGKVVVFDEAHKYLTNKDSARLTKSITSLIRQQRHLGTRIIVSTQEPTIVPESILGLTSYIICHKFSSPSWCAHLKCHVAVDDRQSQDPNDLPWSEEVMKLRTGEALVFSSSTVGLLESSEPSQEHLAPLGVGYLRIRTRPRLTLDGGASILAVRRAPRAPAANTPPPPKIPPVQNTPPTDPEASSKASRSRHRGAARDQNQSQPSTQPEPDPEPPRAPKPKQPSPAVGGEDPRFKHLLDVLREKRAKGNNRPTQKEVAGLVLPRERSIIKTFSSWADYCIAAKDLGLIEFDGTGATDWVSLPPQRNKPDIVKENTRPTPPATSPPAPPTSPPPAPQTKSPPAAATTSSTHPSAPPAPSTNATSSEQPSAPPMNYPFYPGYGPPPGFGFPGGLPPFFPPGLPYPPPPGLINPPGEVSYYPFGPALPPGVHGPSPYMMPPPGLAYSSHNTPPSAASPYAHISPPAAASPFAAGSPSAPIAPTSPLGPSSPKPEDPVPVVSVPGSPRAADSVHATGSPAELTAPRSHSVPGSPRWEPSPIASGSASVPGSPRAPVSTNPQLALSVPPSPIAQASVPEETLEALSPLEPGSPLEPAAQLPPESPLEPPSSLPVTESQPEPYSRPETPLEVVDLSGEDPLEPGSGQGLETPDEPYSLDEPNPPPGPAFSPEPDSLSGPASSSAPATTPHPTALEDGSTKPFEPLIRILNQHHEADIMRPLQTDIVAQLRRDPVGMKGFKGWKEYFNAAEQALVIETGEGANNKGWVALIPPFLKTSAGPVDEAWPPLPTEASTSESAPAPRHNSHTARDPFVMLEDVLFTLLSDGNDKPFRTTVSAALTKLDPHFFRNSGYKKMKDFAEAAQEAGIVELGDDGPGTEPWIALPE